MWDLAAAYLPMLESLMLVYQRCGLIDKVYNERLHCRFRTESYYYQRAPLAVAPADRCGHFL